MAERGRFRVRWLSIVDREGEGMGRGDFAEGHRNSADIFNRGNEKGRRYQGLFPVGKNGGAVIAL